MYAFKIRINDEAPVIAGADDLGILNATVTCAGKLGSGSQLGREDEPADVSITVSGRTSRVPGVPDEHLFWISQKPLGIGDVISVEVVNLLEADAPISGKEAEKRNHDEREYFEHCKKVYLSLYDKYEGGK